MGTRARLIWSEREHREIYKRFYRYLAILTVDELIERGADFHTNAYNFDSTGAITFDFSDYGVCDALSCFREVVFELELRGTLAEAENWVRESVIRSLRASGVPGVLTDRSVRPVKALNEITPPKPGYLVKYGERKYMELAYEAGEIFISPASAFRDTRHKPAVRDMGELSVTLSVPVEVARRLPSHQVPSEFRGRRPLRADITKKHVSDLYVYCMSSKIAPRLFCDFGNYDAALIIEDREEFFQRLGRAVAKKLPGWIMGHGAMQYYDPQRPAYWHLWPALNGSGWKHMRYMYQREYRVRWKPPSPRTDLKAFTVWLGSLKDISRIVTL